MRRFPRALAALLALLALTFVVAACGSDDDSGSSSGGSSSSDTSSTSSDDSGSSGTAIKKDSANASKSITIGSKNFAEQYVLGEIYSQALEAAGFKVTKQLDLGSEQVAFKALKSGKIDAYPEYTGTALTSFYGVKTDAVPRDPQESFDQLKGDLAKDKITPFPQTPFQNTYKVTSTKATADKLGNPKTISELATKAGSKMSISGFPECRQRTDCLLGLKAKYNWTPKFVSSNGQYADLDAKQADFTFGFSTDGPLSTDKYVTYEDDKSLFPPYYVTLMTRDEAVQKLGDSGAKVVEDVQKPLTEQVMQELNARVTIDKQKPEKVAADYLKEAGFVK
jgi:glycine betaine/choline ABC-type transport system substrate-binding protein